MKQNQFFRPGGISNVERFTRHLRAKGLRIAHTFVPPDWRTTRELMDKLEPWTIMKAPYEYMIKGEFRRRFKEWKQQFNIRS